MMQSSANYATKLSLEYRTSFKFSTGYSKFSLGNLVNCKLFFFLLTLKCEMEIAK